MLGPESNGLRSLRSECTTPLALQGNQHGTNRFRPYIEKDQTETNQPTNLTRWVWVKYGYRKWNGKWKEGLKPAVPWWFNFDPYPGDATEASVASRAWKRELASGTTNKSAAWGPKSSQVAAGAKPAPGGARRSHENHDMERAKRPAAPNLLPPTKTQGPPKPAFTAVATLRNVTSL